MSKYRDIPKFFRDDQKKFKDSIKNATNYPLKIYLYDGFDEATGTGYSSREDFISTVLTSSNAPQYEISLNPSTAVETKDFSVKARWIRNITNYSQREDDIVSLIYSQERPVYQIDTELDLRDRLVFFSQESIYGNLIEGNVDIKVPKDIPIFELDSYDPQYDEFGVFQYATITLKRIVSWKARREKTDGTGQFEYVEFEFFIGNIQPTNVKRAKFTWKSKPVNWLYDFKDNSNNTIDWNTTPNTQGKPFISPMLLKKESGTSLALVFSFINEMGYWKANYDKFNVNVKGYAHSTSSITSTSTGTFPNSSVKGLIPSQIYKYAYFSTDPTVVQPDRDNLFKATSQTLDHSSPLNFMGYIREDIKSNYGSINLSRPEDNENAVWKDNKDEAYAYVDAVSEGTYAVVFSTWEMYYSQIKKNPAPFSEKYLKNVLDILKGNATMFGQVITKGNFPSSYKNDFDFTPNPKDWNVEDLRTFTGVYYFNEEDGNIVDTLLDGSSAELELNAITKDDLPTTTGERFTISDIFNTYFELNYGSSRNIKTRQAGRDWYKNYDEDWVMEFEFENNIDILTRIDMNYFGGYGYQIEFFQNSYEDSLINGDKPCEFDFFGTPLKLPPLTYRASNRRASPLSLGESKIYGSGTGAREARNLLIFENKKLLEQGSKKLYNINTGKKIKNKHSKGVK